MVKHLISSSYLFLYLESLDVHKIIHSSSFIMMVVVAICIYVLIYIYIYIYILVLFVCYSTHVPFVI